MVLRAGIVVRALAVLVGLANAYVVSLWPVAFAFAQNESSAPILALVLRAVVSGLLASEVVLRLMRPALRGGFLARYSIAALTVCIGGLIFGASMPLGVLFVGPTEVFGFLTVVVLATLAGGVAGALEGLVLGLPLATVLALSGEQ